MLTQNFFNALSVILNYVNNYIINDGNNTLANMLVDTSGTLKPLLYQSDDPSRVVANRTFNDDNLLAGICSSDVQTEGDDIYTLAHPVGFSGTPTPQIYNQNGSFYIKWTWTVTNMNETDITINSVGVIKSFKDWDSGNVSYDCLIGYGNLDAPITISGGGSSDVSLTCKISIEEQE